MSADDPRVDILAEGLVEEWERRAWGGNASRRGAPTYKRARDLLARLDAAAPARDDALARWLDGEIDRAERKALRIVREVHEMQAQGDAGAGVRSWQSLVRAENRAEVLREVRDRPGATTDTPEEG